MIPTGLLVPARAEPAYRQSGLLVVYVCDPEHPLTAQETDRPHSRSTHGSPVLRLRCSRRGSGSCGCLQRDPAFGPAGRAVIRQGRFTQDLSVHRQSQPVELGRSLFPDQRRSESSCRPDHGDAGWVCGERDRGRAGRRLLPARAHRRGVTGPGPGGVDRYR